MADPGRVHRYKGHAVRINVAKAIGFAELQADRSEPSSDPWATLFKKAAGLSGHELAPFWIFDQCDHPVKIRRLVLIPTLSREMERWPVLTRRLALYRLVLGQPRQEDLLSALERRGVDEDQVRRWRIDLSPPRD